MAKIQRTQIWFDETTKLRKDKVNTLRPKTGWQDLMEIGLEYLEYKHGIKKVASVNEFKKILKKT